MELENVESKWQPPTRLLDVMVTVEINLIQAKMLYKCSLMDDVINNPIFDL